MFQGRSLNQAPSPRLHVESPVSRRQPFNSGQTSRRGCVESSHNGAYGNRSLGRSIAADQRDKFIKLSSVEQVVVVEGRYNWWCKLITRPPFSLPVAWGSTPTATKMSTRTTTTHGNASAYINGGEQLADFRQRRPQVFIFNCPIATLVKYPQELQFKTWEDAQRGRRRRRMHGRRQVGGDASWANAGRF